MLSGYVGILHMTTVHYEATPEGLRRIRQYPLFSRRRFWPRDRIAALRPARRFGDKGRVYTVLELQTVDDRRISVGGGSVELLRFLATRLRHELGVPATDPALDARNPGNLAWQTANEPHPPASMRGTLKEDGAGLVYHVAARPFTRPEAAFVAVSALLAFAIPLAVVLLWPHLQPDDWAPLVLLGGFLEVLFVLAAFAVVSEVRQNIAIVASAEHLCVTTRTPFFATDRAWPRDDLAAIRVESSRPHDPRRHLRLLVTLQNGKHVRYFSEFSPPELRHLATRLRAILHVPALVPDDSAVPSHSPFPEHAVPGQPMPP
jgi:hypothetical protein